MSVTQDYKILTLTASEYHAVRTALEHKERFLKERLSDELSLERREVMAVYLSHVQSALIKASAENEPVEEHHRKLGAAMNQLIADIPQEALAGAMMAGMVMALMRAARK